MLSLGLKAVWGTLWLLCFTSLFLGWPSVLRGRLCVCERDIYRERVGRRERVREREVLKETGQGREAA